MLFYRKSFLLSFATVIACLVSLTAFQTVSQAQGVKKDRMSVRLENATVAEAISAIEKQSDYTFFYKDEDVNLLRRVSLNLHDATIQQVLEQVFKGFNSYSISGLQIYLRRLDSAAKESAKDNVRKGKARMLSGIIVDDISDEPLGFVMVRDLKDKTSYTSADADGNYSIKVTDESELEFSFLGYKTQTKIVQDLGVLDVRMVPDNNVLNEVVVIGAGTQKKVSVTGSISAIEGSTLRQATSSLTSSLAGKLAGVVSMTTSGEPGSTSEFYIRGISTFGGRTTPLILLDDIEISADDLNRLPAESIESFSVLKDASATAIYGSRGANGVMLITTKTGVENSRAKISAKIENSFNHPVNRVEFVDGATWMELYNEALLTRTPTASPRYSAKTIEYTRNKVNPYVFPDVDWYDLLFKEFCMNQKANINLQGGGSKVTYYMGLEVDHDTGLLDVPDEYSFDSNINDYSYVFQNNVAYKPTPTLTVGLNMNAQFGKRKGPGQSTSSIFYDVYDSNPVSFPAYYPAEEGDQHIRFGNSIRSDSRLNVNPYAEMMSSFSENYYSTISTSLRLNQKLDFLTRGLSASLLVNMKNYSYSSYTNTITPYYYRVTDGSWNEMEPDFFITEVLKTGTDYISQGSIYRYNDRTFYLDGRINYDRRFGRHSLTGMLMYMQREYRNDVLPNRNQGFSGRFTYNYSDRYLAEFNFGYNGTERLDKGDRFEFFPALSLGWVLSNEDFWEPLRGVVSHFKIRSSYGLVGSDETGLSAGAAHFLYKDEVNLSGGGVFYTGADASHQIGKQGISYTHFAVNDASWEKARKFDLGLDVILFNQINVVFDYFYDHRYKILQARGSWPVIMGYGSAVPWSNIGKVDNKGFELSVNWRKAYSNSLSFDIRGNLTYNNNKYKYTDEPDYPYVWQTQTGKPLAATYGYLADGLFVDEEDVQNSPSQNSLGSRAMPGDIKYRDINGDGMISDQDRIMVSRFGSIPRIQYGIGVSLNYKKADFNVFFNGSAQRTIMLNNIAPFCTNDSNNDRNLMKFIADDYWSESNPNPNAAYPRLGVSSGQISNNMVPSTFWKRCGNFLRFKTLEVGYSFPPCRIYFTGENLAVWSPFKYWDPELWWNSYPLQRILSVGVQVTL